MGSDAEVEVEATEVEGGRALGLADEIGDGDLLGAEAFGDADGPLAADGGSGGGVLGENAAGRGGGGVEAIFEGEAEAEGGGFAAGVGDGEAAEVGDFSLSTVDGETHGDEGGEERDGEHREGAEGDVEEAVDGAEFYGGGHAWTKDTSMAEWSCDAETGYGGRRLVGLWLVARNCLVSNWER